MNHPPRIIQDNPTFKRCFHKLQPGDIIATRLSLRPNEEHLLLDLVARGVQLIPSATAQLASRSKAFQTRVFQKYMIPGTTVIYDPRSLLESIPQYQQRGVGKVVVKHDRKNAGLGIFLFNSIEEVYTMAANNGLAFPFVLQPFLHSHFDIRVIFLGSYIEAYQRKNPDNFRNNLHCGGIAEPHELTPVQMEFCQDVMARGNFPYCHLDLMVTEKEELYLAEINLRGGIHGAKISTTEYDKKRKQLIQEHLAQYSPHLP